MLNVPKGKALYGKGVCSSTGRDQRALDIAEYKLKKGYKQNKYS